MMQNNEDRTHPFEEVASEIIEKLCTFVLGVRYKVSKAISETPSLVKLDFDSWCEHLNANLGLAIDIILCPKHIQPSTVEAHQLLERWVLTYEPSGSKGEVAKPLPKALDGLTFLLRSLNGYAGSMPLHSILKDPAHFTFLYGVPSPSCRSTKETNFEERPSVFLFAPLKAPCGTFTFSVKFRRNVTVAEGKDFNLILQPSCSTMKYTCNHGTSPPSTPLPVAPRTTEPRRTSPPVDIPNKKKGHSRYNSKEELSSSPYASASFLLSSSPDAAEDSPPSPTEDIYNSNPTAQPQPPQGLQRPLSYATKSSCSFLYNSPPIIRRSSFASGDHPPRPGNTKLRRSRANSSKEKAQENVDNVDIDDEEENKSKKAIVIKGKHSFSPGEKGAFQGYKAGPSPSDLLGPFVGSFEESILNGRMCDTPSTLFEGFSFDVAVSGRNYASKHIRKDFVAIYYHIQHDTPYVGTLDLQCKNKLGMRVPLKGVLQATIFNPTRTPIKTFLVKYDLEDMPEGTKTFLRQKMVTKLPGGSSILRYAIHLRFACPVKKKFYLRSDVRVLFPHRVPDDMDELKVLYDCPVNPKYFPG